MSNVMEIWEPKPTGNLRLTPSLLRDCFYKRDSLTQLSIKQLLLIDTRISHRTSQLHVSAHFYA